jgi:UDP-2-acetamido-2-deoxy-ribo-hexuluronate aminotransferase
MNDRMTRVPFIDITRFNATLREAVLADWAGVYDRAEFVGGQKVRELEDRLVGRLGAAHAVACANGTDALIVGLQSLGVARGDLVAIPNLTFWATYEAVVAIGAVPVLVDVSAADLQMDFDGFCKAFAEYRFRAAILVHLYGWCSGRLAEFRDFCATRDVLLLEDGAQAFGTEAAGHSIFAGAQAATLSFYPAKVLGGVLDGGAILARDKHVADRARSLCNHGRAAHYSYAEAGWNSRMGGLQASFLLHALDRVDAGIESRRAALDRYRSAVAGCDGVTWHDAPAGVRTNGYLAVACHARATGDDMVARLRAKGVECGRVYPETVDSQQPAASAVHATSLDVSREFCRRVFNPPLFHGITAEECAHVIRAMHAVFSELEGAVNASV